MNLNISFSAWNINGMNHRTLGEKLTNQDFLDNIKDHDFIFLIETWTTEINSIPGFKAISTCTAKSNCNGRISGGISLLFKSKFESMVTVEKLTKNFLWCLIDKSVFNASQDLFLCGVYIPPIKSPYFNDEIFENLEADMLYFSQKGNIMLLGDFNARPSKLDDFVSKDGNKFINDLSENSTSSRIRNNFDNLINVHGKSLIEICKNCNLRILNGRTLGDSLGRPTYHGKNGTSLVDYVICDQDLTETIENLIIKPPTYLSDHSQILTWIKTNQANIQNSIDPNVIVSTPITRQHELPAQFIWDNNSARYFKESLQSYETQTKLNQLINTPTTLSKEGINDFAYQFHNIIINAAKNSMRLKKKKYRHSVTHVCNKKWFDKECRLKRHTVRKLANQKHRDPLNCEIRNEYHIALKSYKNTLKLKKELFHQNKLQDLEQASESDPNSFWKTLKNMSDSYDNPSTNSTDITAENWTSHFKSLHTKHNLGQKQHDILQNLDMLENQENQMNILDDPITEYNILSAAKKLKNKKSAYSDKITN